MSHRIAGDMMTQDEADALNYMGEFRDLVWDFCEDKTIYATTLRLCQLFREHKAKVVQLRASAQNLLDMLADQWRWV